MRKTFGIVAVVSAFISLFAFSYAEIGVCSHYYKHEQKFFYYCGWLWNKKCTRYVQYSEQLSIYCCTGYQHYPNCYPVCDGKTILNDACNEQYYSDVIVYRGGETRDRGGGSCSSPENCTNCADGFYGDSGRCLICPSIVNCNHRRCTSSSDNYCEYCQYEIKDRRSWRGYTRHFDGEMKQCKKACSWRSDSTRCFPGECTNETVETCSCTSGFGGSQCDTITEESDILFAEIKLHNPSEDIVTTPVDPSDTGQQPTRFTNKNDLNAAEIEFHGKFMASGTPPAHDPSGENHFVTDFDYGIVYGEMKLEYVIGSSSNTHSFNCPGLEEDPIKINYICSRTRSNNSSISIPIFGHGDRLIFSIEIRNGGYLTYINRELNTTVNVSLTGMTTTRNYTVQWDLNPPFYPCFQLLGTNCTETPIDVEDVTYENRIPFSWKQWNDDLADIERYEYEVYHLLPHGNVLREADMLFSSFRTPDSNLESSLNVTTPGMYSILLTAFDKAGNYKSTRSLFLFDNQSFVETTPGTRTTVIESTLESNYTWVVFDTSPLNVTWAGRFMNERHDVYKWLNEIDTNKHVDHDYDDRFGRRTVQWFPNVKGIVRFDINYTVTGTNIESSIGYTEVQETLREASLLNISWDDGDKLDISVKATDIIGKYTEDKITIYKDTSYPAIENLWLSYGNKSELFVHRQQDLTSMTFEWDTFDYHSGIYSVHWKLFDNYTGSDMIHGSSHLQAQGDASNLSYCENKYKNSPRGSDCYCTLHHGCFHRHFHVKPEIVNGSGLTPGKDKGLHDSDYFIKITVVNKAMLKSILTKKITIDISPPQSGSVHDGLPGTPEVDYQQDLNMNFYWYGFFDPESGIKYYKYIVANDCWTKQNLMSSKEGRETYETTTSYNATKEGKYQMTVMAVNSANEPSEAVCSDGVTIITEKPNVKNVLIHGVKTAPRIVTDSNNTMWIIRQNLTRGFINETTWINTTNILSVEDIELFPEVERTASDVDIFQASAMNSLFVFVLQRTEQLNITWDSNIEEYIYDYYIGLSSTNDNPAPDLLPFRSTKHHSHFRLNHPDLTEGTLFYVIIKSVSKANVEGIQSYGPIIIDETPPTFTGSLIDLKFEDSTLIANWSRTAFTDYEDPYPLHYQFALGHVAGKTDVFHYQPLLYSKTCIKTQPPECVAIDTSTLDWSLHGHHDYYVTIKVTNVAGLSSTQTSVVYTHDTQLPSPGIVYDINPISVKSRALQDLIDIDFAVQSNTLAVEWKGFYHPHLHIHYKVCIGTVKGGCDIAMKDNLNWTSNQYTFTNLLLSDFQTYFSTVEAVATTGSVKVSTDGVTIVNNSTELEGVIVNDGPICSDAIVLNRSHHSQDVILNCKVDINYQISTTTLQAKWNYPNNLTDVINNVYWSIDRRSAVGDVWFQFRDFSYIGSQKHIAVSGLDLQPGLKYRFSMKFCAHSICFPTISSDGVTVVPSYPIIGSIEVHLEDQKIIVIFAMMYDPDIEDRTESIDAIESYEWTITDNFVDGKQFEKWGLVDHIQAINNTHFKAEIPLSGDIDFAKCKHVTIRGTNKVGVWSVISAEIKQCHVEDGQRQVVPRIVIDAIGDGEIDSGMGKNINLETNAAWPLLDEDYTPFKNVLSAVWPTLRHTSYQWGVIQIKSIDAQTFYKELTDIVISDPCSHPDSVQCGQTEDNYVNAMFNKTKYLIHGGRYSICIHAPETVIEHEKWTETLETVTSCSDGVTVDLTPPVPGRVWVGADPLVAYQTSSSDLYVAWDSFIDVEDTDHSMHFSGIRQYSISIGSIEGGNDLIDRRNVGLTNHMSFHSLQLQNGHKYFVTLRGFDMIGRYSEIRANPITVDTTPPEWTGESISISGRLLSNLSEIEACWENVFMDSQSGIDHFIWGVGSMIGIDDIIPFSMTFQECAIPVQGESYVLSEGQPYFITITAFDRAKLSTTRSSWAYIYDISPPTAGHVYDGRNDNIHTSTKDIDFQTNMTHLFFRWEGFHDPHSVIKYYSVHIGTCPGCNNVMTEQTVGVHTDFTLHSFHIEAGIKYFGTVVACNTGNLCTAVTSDGVIIDNSPPVPGVVQDGTNVYDNEYQSLRNFLSAKWFGFTDAQSEIDYFVIRVGTARGSGDIYPPRIITAHDMVLLTDLPEPLHLNRRIYTTIRAYNKAGLYSESTSNGVTVDISGPDIIEKPYFTRDLGSIVEGTSVLRSTLRLQWRVDDLQSSIHRQYLSLSSHMYGEMNTSRIMLNGIAREYTLTGLDLNDGSSYYVKLIVCNGAQICTETETDKILVDSTPPSSGMFAISTSHAANLQRHTQGWMTWSDYRLNIALLGFIDLHTDIDKYYVSVGRDFMTDNLNKVPGTPMVFYHNDSTPEYLDEGPIQLFVVPTQQLNNVDTVFISAWGVNKVGLCSYMIHYQFQLVSGGYLDLLRRCTPLTCLGHCVCSSLGARCHPNGDSCSDVSADNKNTLITVSDLTDFSGSNDNDIQFTPSNSHLSAKWEIVKRQGLSPLWYEWSVGLSSQESPRGVINTTTDPLWHYSGQKMEVIYCLKRGQQLSELLTYSIFVRVWYSSNAYATFKSNGVTVVSEPVAVNRQRGAAVVEKNPAFWKSDVDFIKPGSVFTMNWENVFIGSSGMIEKFNVYLSTFEGGADLHKVNEDIDSSTSAVNISRLNMLPGVRYYSNVVAYTFSGLQTTVSSDGIMIDNSPPVTGVVDDGLGLHDIDFQNKSDVVAATWHGFTDIGAGIEIYFWCVGTNKMDQTCDVLPLKNVGIQTSVSSMLPNHLQNGQQVFSKLMAVDGVGHTTDMISSNGVTIDTTPPVPISFIHADANLVVNPSFEESKGCFMEIMDISDYHICDVDNCYNPSLWNGDGCVATIKSDVDTAYDGRSFIFLKGVLQQNIQQLSPGNLYRVTFVTSHLPISGAVVSNIEGSVMFNDKEHVFHIFPKENKSDISWHLHTFYFKPKTDDGDIKITNRDKNLGFLIDCIKIQKADIQPSSEIESTVHVHTVGLHRWSSIHASWNFEDSESPISEYIWAIGYTKGNEEMQRFQSVGANNFAYNYNLTLPHASQVFVTVVAKNSAGLRYAAYSSGLNIDQTPPVIDKIHDGAGVDIDGQTSNIITANWDASDTESGLEYCEWSIGLQPYGNELQPFTKTVNLKSASATLDESIISQKTVYATVRCHNNAGSYSSSTSDGVTISNIPPSSDHAAITVIPQSLTEYSPGYFHQQDKQSVRIKWSGFTDQFNIMSFVVQFEGEKMYLKNSILDINKQVSYFVMNGLDLPDAVYTTNVVAINSMYIRSSRLTTNVTVQSSAPTVVEGSNITTTKKGDDITLSWTNCFTYPGRLVYEVSVGTVQGGADVIQWQETTENIMIIKLTEKLKTKVNLNLYCFIRAIGESGIFSSKSDDVNT